MSGMVRRAVLLIGVAFAALTGGLLFLLPAMWLAPTLLVAWTGAAVLAEGRMSPLALTSGAGAALSFAALFGEAPVVAGGLAFSLSFLPRCLRGRTVVEGALQAAVALVAGAASIWIALSYSVPLFPAALAAAVIAALVSALPWLFPVDDHMTARLHEAARACAHPLTREQLLHAVDCRRRLVERLSELPRQEAARIEAAFEAILVSSRRLAGSATPHLTSNLFGRLLVDLARADLAIERRSVMADEPDVHASAELEHLVDGIEAETSALVELSRLDEPVDVRQ